jgi:nucleolar GTP-binding protein
MLESDDWKEDVIPEIMEGKNVADFIDPDIAEKLEALEREEEKLEAEGFYESDDDVVRSRSFDFLTILLLTTCLLVELRR